jgi:biotin-(acetyl-CoA carboxylase) ligase
MGTTWEDIKLKNNNNSDININDNKIRLLMNETRNKKEGVCVVMGVGIN